MEEPKHRKIGRVILDYTYYTGSDLYSDGAIEDELLNIVKEGKQKEALAQSNRWPILYHLSDIRENLLEWYSFDADAEVLEVGSGCGGVTGLLSRKAKHLTCVELSEKRSLINAYRHKECDNVEIILGNFQDIEPDIGLFDYITLIGVWEYSQLYIKAENPYFEMLNIMKKHLKPNGRIIIAIENKMGLKYWNGAVEDHTGKMYSGLNDYTFDTNRKVRTFSKPEIEGMLDNAGIHTYKFYYPMPDYKLPDVIYTDHELPKPGSERNYRKDYNAPRVYNFNDAIISDQLCADNMFPYFANSFLVVAGDGEYDTAYAKYNRCRKEEFRIKTEIIEKNNKKTIKKTALNGKAEKHINRLKENTEHLSVLCHNPNIVYVKGNIDSGGYTQGYVEGTDLESLFYLYRLDSDKFVQMFNYYADIVFKTDENDVVDFNITDDFRTVFGEAYPSNAISLKFTNVDMIFPNIKYVDNKFYCFDPEWCFDFPIPYEYVKWRAAKQIYSSYRGYLKQRISESEFIGRVEICNGNLPIYATMESHFGEYVFGKSRNEVYLKNYVKNAFLQEIRSI
jgi:precorrin-6B methylase 2